MLEFRILGPLEVVGENGPIRLGGPRQRATLAILLLNANRVVSIERLADDLYAGRPPVTAVTQVARQVSELRKALGPEAGIETRPPGYVIQLAPEQLDLRRFERSGAEAARALERGDAEVALERQLEALELWRGDPLADLADEAFARIAIERLEEIRLAAFEQRIEAELALGRHRELIAELEELSAEHPLRELLCSQLMLALYRSGRQAEALDAFRQARDALVEGFGLEPAPALRDLERAILTQDPALDLERTAASPVADPAHTLLVIPSDETQLDTLVALAKALATLREREVVIARLLEGDSDLSRAAATLSSRCSALGVHARTAAFTTVAPADDVVRLARSHDVDVVLLDATLDSATGSFNNAVSEILERSPADVAVLAGHARAGISGKGVFVPFGGGEHDWAALELAAWLARSLEVPLRLVGTSSDPRLGRRDASRLLADASLAVQKVVGIETEPLLVEPSPAMLVAAVEIASVVVVGMPERWQIDGIGPARCALVEQGVPPTLLVHGGPRPGGLAPRESRTRFSWSIAERSL